MDTGLDEHQQQALAQLQTLTNGGDEQAAIDILASVDWDVQRAAEIIFDAPSTSTAATAASTSTTSSTAPPVPSASKREAFEIDDSEQGQSSSIIARPRRQSHPQPYNPRPLPWRITTLLFYPLHLVSSVLRFVFGLLRIPLPQLNLRFAAFTPRGSINRSLRPPAPNPRVAAERWIRALEEETGGIVMSSSSEAQASASGVEVGPSTSTARNTAMTSAAARGEHDGRKVLPNFIVDSYEGVLRRAQREAKIACVVLVSEEHDDDAEFKRSTLTDPAFVQLLNENDMLVWGGDVRDKDAWSAAQKLQATTYPFVAFAALQPRRTPFTSRPSSSSSSSTSPTMTVLSRHQGPCVPSGAATSASKLVDHLTAQLLPRVLPFLERIQHQARERERDRELRAEQERAYEDAARRDRARIEALMEQDRDVARRREQEKLEQEAREQERERRRRAAEKRMAWRRWTRRAVVGARLESDYHDQQAGGNGGRPLRIAFRLPGNPRLVRQFSGAETLTDLFAFVDAVLVPSAYAPREDPVTPPDADEGVEQGVVDPTAVLLAQMAACPGGADTWWEFKLFNAYPRREIQWDSQTKLGEVDVLRGGAQLVVEPVVARVSSPSRAAADHGDTPGNNDGKDDSDGYDTEDSE